MAIFLNFETPAPNKKVPFLKNRQTIIKIEISGPLTMWNRSGSSRAFVIWHRDLQALSRDRVMTILLNFETPAPNKIYWINQDVLDISTCIA